MIAPAQPLFVHRSLLPCRDQGVNARTAVHAGGCSMLGRAHCIKQRHRQRFYGSEQRTARIEEHCATLRHGELSNERRRSRVFDEDEVNAGRV